MKLNLVAALMSLLVFGACTKKVDTNEKVLSIVAIAKVKGLDPIYTNDRYSSNEVARVYEGLLEYHYLKRPYTLTPNLAQEMPTVSKDGLTYTFKIKKGVMFHDDAAFPGGKGRELTAEDFVYSIKRLADPRLQALGWWLLDGKIAGLNEWRKKYAEKEATDYSEEVEGLKALDKYTLQFKLSRPFPQFLDALTMPFTFVVAKEAVEKYGKEFLNHPVGTGPFVLPKFTQTNKIVYTKNPNYRDKLYPSEASGEFNNEDYLKFAGQKLPLLDKLIVHIIVENQPRWLNFQKANVDWIRIPKDNFDSAITPSKGLTDELEKKGILVKITPALDLTYTGFNHDLKLFQNVKLRRAMSLAYDVNKANELFYNSTALPAQSIVPPGIAGNDTDYKNPYRGPDIEKAKKLLAEAGYPNGKGLPELTYDCSASTLARQIGEFLKQEMAKIGVKVKVQTNPWPELQKKITNRSIMLYGIAWGADYPDAENFLQLLYGPNRAPGANGSGYNNPVFNAMYKKASIMQPGPERTALYEKMNKMVAEQAPLLYGVHRQYFDLVHGWFTNFIRSDFEAGHGAYYGVDLELKKKLIGNF